MNEFNVKRLRRALELLNDIEEEIVPAFAEEDNLLGCLCNEEIFSSDSASIHNHVIDLEEALYCVVTCRDHLKNVLGMFEED